MKIKYLGIMALSLQIVAFSAHSINYRMLDERAQTCHVRILANIQDSEGDIKARLTFANESDALEEKYLEDEGFMAYQATVNDTLQSSSFLTFSKTCQKIFSEADNPVTKASVYMLFEGVAEKSLKLFKRKQKALDSKKKRPSSRDIHTDVSLEKFFSDRTPIETR